MSFGQKIMLFTGVITFSILTITGSGYAGRVHIAPGGDDSSGDGTRTNPWRTIRYISENDLAGGGDTIIVMPGTYRGESVIGLHDPFRGEPDNYLVIMGDPAAVEAGYKPVFDGQNIDEALFVFYSKWVEGDNDQEKLDVAYLKIQDLIFRNSQYHGINICDGGHPSDLNDSRGTPAHDIIFKNLEFYNCERTGLKMAGVDNFLIEDCTFNNLPFQCLDMVGCHNGTVRNCTFTDCMSRSGSGIGVVAKGGSKDITIDRCYFKDLRTYGVMIGATTSENLFRPPVYSNDSDGNLMDYEAKNINVYRCLFDNIGTPIKWSCCRENRVYNNTIYCPKSFDDSEYSDGGGTLVAVFNIYEMHTEVAGDTLVWSRDGIVKNNLIYYGTTHMYPWLNKAVYVQSEYTHPETFEFSNNLFYCHANPDSSFPEWDRVGNPIHSNNITGDPLFITAYPEFPQDLRIGEGSPAIGSGAIITDEIFDFFDNKYLDRLDYNDNAWPNPPTMGAFGVAAEYAPPSSPIQLKILPGEVR